MATSLRDVMDHITVLDRTAHLTLPDLPQVVRRVRESWEERDMEVPAVVVCVDPLHRLLNPDDPEVEGLGRALNDLLSLAQRERAIVLLTSDTTRAAASARGSVAGLQRAEDLADAIEMAFRGSYQLLHLPDVALGLVTVQADDENLPEEVRKRLEAQPDGTLYAELGSAKARWFKRGQRAAYWMDPAMFRFRPTMAREMPRELSLKDRIVEYIEGDPGCSESRVRTNVTGGDTKIRQAVAELFREKRIEDRGDARGRALFVIPGTPHGTRPEQVREQGGEQVGDPEPVPGGSPLWGGEPTLGTGALRSPERHSREDGG